METRPGPGHTGDCRSLERLQSAGRTRSNATCEFSRPVQAGYDSLVDHLQRQNKNTRAKHQLWPLPPIVGATAALLLLMVGLTMILADWGEITSGAAVGKSLTLFELAILFSAVGFFVWHTSIAYLRRRMGMTRLAVILGSSIIFSLRGWLDVASRHTQVSSRWPKSSAERSTTFCF